MRLPPLTQKILDRLHQDRESTTERLHSDIQELISAIRDQQTAERKHPHGDQHESNLPERILRAERQLHEYQQRDQRTYNNLQLWVQIVLAIGTWLAFVAAFIYAGIALRQWQTMNNTFEQIKRQAKDFEIVQAARLTFEEPKIRMITAGQFQLEFTIAVRNSGPSAAYQVQIESRWGFAGSIPAESSEKPQSVLNGGISIGPNETRKIHYRRDQLITPQMLAKFPQLKAPAEKTLRSIERGETKVFVNPSVSYVDIFGDYHRTTDCWTYESAVSQWIPCSTPQHHD